MRPPPKRGAPRRLVHVPKPSLGDVDDDSTAFRSPEPDDATDYGLEFTTSQLTLQDASNRRCSTLRKDISAVRRARAGIRSATSDEDIENRFPVSRSPQTRRSTSQRIERISTQPAAVSGAQKRKKRKPMSHVIRMEREIRRLQSNSGLLIPRLPFSRLVREIMYQLSHLQMRVTEAALQVMQESSELYLTHRLQDSYLLTQHRGRVTLEVRDMALMAFLCNQGH
uniref:Cid4 n=1 Tax=Drosophila rufa TaxID=67533 RepID=A0A1V0HS01_9MUSC|nr:Cid4 [Drosophila rufa]